MVTSIVFWYHAAMGIVDDLALSTPPNISDYFYNTRVTSIAFWYHAAMGIVDDLPNRFAFEQLNALSGMATKVQDAINHNKALFQQRMWLEDSAILRKCMNAWRGARFGSVQKQQVLLRAIQRIRVGVL